MAKQLLAANSSTMPAPPPQEILGDSGKGNIDDSTILDKRTIRLQQQLEEMAASLLLVGKLSDQMLEELTTSHTTVLQDVMNQRFLEMEVVLWEKVKAAIPDEIEGQMRQMLDAELQKSQV